MSRPENLPRVSARGRDRVVIALNRGFFFELQNQHLWLHSHEFGGEDECRLDHCSLCVKQKQKGSTSFESVLRILNPAATA